MFLIVLALTSVPGISDMGFEGRDPDQAGVVCIKPLLVQLMDELNHRGISADNWPSFPIFLKATGGMRNLEIVTRARIMNSIRRYLANDVGKLFVTLQHLSAVIILCLRLSQTEVPFAFHWNWARIIAGTKWLFLVDRYQSLCLLSYHEFISLLCRRGGRSLRLANREQCFENNFLTSKSNRWRD